MTTIGAPTRPIVEIENVSKWFGQKVAVSEFSYSFAPGVTGLLGPNGAGKTTLMRVIVGLMRPSSGTVSISGLDPRSDPSAYSDIGFMPEDEAVYLQMTAFEFIEWSAALSKVDDPTGATQHVLQVVELTDEANRPLGTFSKGMRQRAKVAAALVHDPSVLLLDEPLNGADPVQRANLISLFRRLGEEGRALIVSSHVLSEVERVADTVVAMVDGRLAAAGSVPALRNAMSDTPRQVRIETDRPRALAVRLLEGDWVEAVRVSDDAVHVSTVDALALGSNVASAARAVGARLKSFTPEDSSLESVFRYLVGGQ